MGTDITSREQKVGLSSNRFVVVTMLTAGNSAAETATPSCDEADDSFPLIEEILYQALRKRGLSVGEHCSTANAGRGAGEEALSEQRDNTIYNSVSTPGNSLGNTQGELYPAPQNTKAQIQFMLTDLAKIIRLLSVMTRTCLRPSSPTFGRAVLVREVERQRRVPFKLASN
jgi:hypothetical protein